MGKGRSPLDQSLAELRSKGEEGSWEERKWCDEGGRGHRGHDELNLSPHMLSTFTSWKQTATPAPNFLREVCIHVTPETDNQIQHFSIYWVTRSQQTPWGRVREAWPEEIGFASMQGSMLHKWNRPCQGRV